MMGGLLERLGKFPVFSQGETLEELKENIEDAYRMMLELPETAILPNTIHLSFTGSSFAYF
jgi:predicted RNase H-like HicB family nuclease